MTYSDYNIIIPNGKYTGQVYTTCPKCSHERKKKTDKCLGVNWDRIRFGSEENDLLVHGIVINDMEDKVFRWVPEDVNKSNTVDPGWTTVKSKSSVKRARQKNKPAFTKIGIFA